jgi:hypothetical protein
LHELINTYFALIAHAVFAAINSIHGFWIAAPPAAKRAALQEDRSPYARAIMQCESLDVEYLAFGHFKLSCLSVRKNAA